MKIKKFTLKIVLIFLLVTKSYADSPLTSIEIWRAFPENLEIQNALKTKKMSNSTLEFILNEENSLELRICVINALGWNMNSKKNNSRKLLKAILEKYRVKSIDKLNEKKNSEILSCYSYLYAMDNYLNMDKILSCTRQAVALDPENKAVSFVYSLIQSQNYFLTKDWCKLYLTFENFKKKEFNFKNIDNNLIKLTSDYINVYNKYCPKRVI